MLVSSWGGALRHTRTPGRLPLWRERETLYLKLPGYKFNVKQKGLLHFRHSPHVVCIQGQESVVVGFRPDPKRDAGEAGRVAVAACRRGRETGAAAAS